MDRLFFSVVLTFALLAAPRSGEAQQPTKIYRIGWLTLAAGPTPRTQSFLKGLRDLGYVEGRHFVMEFRRAPDNPEKLDELAAQLVQAKVDVIVAAGTQASVPAVRSTATIPVVFLASYPMERAMVASLARLEGTRPAWHSASEWASIFNCSRKWSRGSHALLTFTVLRQGTST